MSDWLTILRCDEDHRAAKAFRWKDGVWTSKDYDCGRLFEWQELQVGSIEDLSRELMRIEEDRRAFVVRGEPMPDIDRWVRRLKHDKDEHTPANFRGVDRRWACFDLDKSKVPPTEIATEPCEAAVRWAIRECLPESFHDAACHYQWSNSAGIKPWSDGLRLHLWFWLDRAVCDASWRAWARARRGTDGAVDSAVFTPVQPHYTARPIVKGLEDPIAKRSGLIVGRAHARVPVEVLGEVEWDRRIEDEERARREAAKGRDPAHEGRARDAKQAYARAALQGVCKEILDASEGARHDTINGGSYKIGRLLVAGGLDFGATLTALQDAGLAVLPKSRHGEALRVPREGLEAGMANPNDLADKGLRAGHRAERERPKGDRQDAPKEPETSEEGGEEPIGKRETATDTKRAVSDWFSERTRRLTVSGRLVGPDGELGAEAVPGVHGAPQPDARVPVGFYVSPWATGWWGEGREGPKHGQIVPCPVVIAGRCIDVDTNEHMLLIAWKDPAGWARRLIPREDALSQRVQQLSKWGMPVTADAAKSLSKFLVAFEAENYQAIPTLRTSRVFGWQGDAGAHGFLLGFQHVTTDEKPQTINLDRWSADRWSRDAVAFRAMSDGDRQFAAAFRTRGKLDAWVEAVRSLKKFPKATLGIYAAFAPPLLELLGTGGFAMDWAARSSSGKSTVLAVCASVWGDPEALTKTWDNTEVFFERTLETLHSLPFFCDETQRANGKTPDLVPNVIYMAANGHGRGRGNISRTEATRTWRTVLMSTGEQAATSFGERGGAKARVVQISGRPFGAEDAVTGGLVKFVADVVRSNYGHAGEAWVRWVMSRRDDWDGWADDFRGYYKDFVEDTKSGPEARLAQARAALEVTRRLVDKALRLDLGDPVSALWGEVTAHAADAAGDVAAMAAVVAWYVANRSAFLTHDSNLERAPHGGWLGEWRPGDYAGLAVMPAALDKVLAELGYQPKAILAAWRERGWVEVEKDSSRAGAVGRRVSLRTGRARCVCIPARLVTDDVLDIATGPALGQNGGQ